MMNLKNFIKKALFLVLICCLSACAKPQEKILTVTMSLGEEEWQLMRSEIFPRFEQQNNIKIRSYQIESSQLAMKLEALKLAGKSEIDVFAQDNMNLAHLVNKDLVLDLTAYEHLIANEVLLNLVHSCKFSRKLMFMPFRPNVQIVYYNEKVFKKYNLNVPVNWDQLLDVARKFKQKEGMGRILLKGFGGAPTATQVYEFVVQAGGDPYAFNDQGCIKAFSFLQQLAQYLSLETKRAKWDTTNDILAKQHVYLAQNWPFGVVILVKDYGLNWIKTYHGWSGPAGEFHVIGGDVFGIPENSRNKNLALKFILFMQTKEIQELLVSKLAWPSIRTDAYTQAPQWQRSYFKSVKEALAHGVFRKNINWWPVYEKYVTEAFFEIVYEKAPVKQTLDKYKIRMEKEKKRFTDKY